MVRLEETPNKHGDELTRNLKQYFETSFDAVVDVHIRIQLISGYVLSRTERAVLNALSIPVHEIEYHRFRVCREVEEEDENNS